MSLMWLNPRTCNDEKAGKMDENNDKKAEKKAQLKYDVTNIMCLLHAQIQNDMNNKSNEPTGGQNVLDSIHERAMPEKCVCVFMIMVHVMSNKTLLGTAFVISLEFQ